MEAQSWEALERIRPLLVEGQPEEALAVLNELRPADQADVIASLELGQQAALMARLGPRQNADIFANLDHDVAARLANLLGVPSVAAILDEAEANVAADVLGDLSPVQSAAVVELMETADTVRPLMGHADQTAGGVMEPAPIVLRVDMSADEAIAYLRHEQPSSEAIYYLFVLDNRDRLVGVVSLRQLVIAAPDTSIGAIMNTDVIAVQAGADQEEVSRLIEHYDLLAIPVVDADQRLLGVITADEALSIRESEDTEDMYRMVGLSEDEHVFSPLPYAIRKRLPWLLVNLATAFLASLVVSLFEGTIAKLALLAVFMPIVAGQGGNTGTQSLTIMVRGLALGELRPTEWWRALRKEVLLGLFNGAIIGAIAGTIAIFWQGNIWVAVVLWIALVGNIVIAGLMGVLIPLTLRGLRFDPALGSGVLLTTFTDIFGFLLFLGISTLILARTI